MHLRRTQLILGLMLTAFGARSNAQPTDASQFALLAGERLKLGKRASVAGGALGANGKLLLSAASATAPSTPIVAPGLLRTSRNTILQDDVYCNECRLHQRTLATALLATGVSLEEIPLPDVASISPVGPRVSQEDSSPLQLDAGQYESVDVGPGGSLLLAGGSYQIGELKVRGSKNRPTNIACTDASGCTVEVSSRLIIRGNLRISGEAQAAPVFLYSGTRAVPVGGTGAKVDASVIAPYAALKLGARGYYAGQFVGKILTVGSDAVVVGSPSIPEALESVEDAVRTLFPEIPEDGAEVPLDELPADAVATLTEEFGSGMLISRLGSLDYKNFTKGRLASTLLAGLFHELDEAGIETRTLREVAEDTLIYAAPEDLVESCKTAKTYPRWTGWLTKAYYISPLGTSIGKIHIFVCVDHYISLERQEWTRDLQEWRRDLHDPDGPTTTILHEMMHAMEMVKHCWAPSDVTYCDSGPSYDEHMAEDLGEALTKKLEAYTDRIVGNIKAANVDEPGREIWESLRSCRGWRTCYGHVGLDQNEPWCGNGKVELSEKCDDGNRAGGDCCSPVCVPETNPACVGPTATAVPTATPIGTPTPTPTAVATPTPTPTPTPTAISTSTPTPTPTPTAIATPTPTPTPTRTPTPTPTPTRTSLPPPGNFSIAVGCYENPTRIEIVWGESAGADEYDVYKNGGVIQTQSLAGYTDTAVSVGNPYTYKVRARNAGGETDSNQVTVTPGIDCGLSVVPVIDSITPTEITIYNGPLDITIDGQNFDTGITYIFWSDRDPPFAGNTQATTVTSTRLTYHADRAWGPGQYAAFYAPGLYYVQAFNPVPTYHDGQRSNTVTFRVYNPVPTITSIVGACKAGRNCGPANGYDVRVYGNGLVNNYDYDGPGVSTTWYVNGTEVPIGVTGGGPVFTEAQVYINGSVIPTPGQYTVQACNTSTQTGTECATGMLTVDP